ncbi:hypothetical protein AMTRI_Chr01g126200 [Amborella trichopoda]
MLLFHLVLALVIVLEVGASLLLVKHVSNVAEMRDIVFQLDFLARMLLFHLVLALVIILEVGASLLLINSDAHYMVTVLVSNNKNNLIMRRNLLITVRIGMTWRKRRNKRRNIWKKRNWRPVFNQLPTSLSLSLSLSLLY